MIRRAETGADARQMLEEPPERRAVREEDGEVIEPEPAVCAQGRAAALLDQLDQRQRLAIGVESSRGCGRGSRLKPEHRRVVVERPREIADLQPYVSEAQGGGQ